MNDVVTEKLTQKVVNLVEEVTEVNILVRRLDSTKETLNKINERNYAIHAAIVHIEKNLKLDDKRITALEAQTKSLEAQTAALMTGLDVQQAQTKLLQETLEEQKKQSEQFKQTVQMLELVMRALEGKINGQTAKIGEDLRGRIGAAAYLQVKWLIIVGAALFFVLLVFALRH